MVAVGNPRASYGQRMSDTSRKILKNEAENTRNETLHKLMLFVAGWWTLWILYQERHLQILSLWRIVC
jgi:hypothetical protein